LEYAAEKRARPSVPLSGWSAALAEAVEGDDGPATRRVVKFQTEQILLCKAGKADLDEMIPLGLLLRAARQLS
jgi:hypothetical protein